LNGGEAVVGFFQGRGMQTRRFASIRRNAPKSLRPFNSLATENMHSSPTSLAPISPPFPCLVHGIHITQLFKGAIRSEQTQIRTPVAASEAIHTLHPHLASIRRQANETSHRRASPPLHAPPAGAYKNLLYGHRISTYPAGSR
jgi:hypothetical protein